MSRRILLVEDEPLLLEATREDLTDLGHEVFCARNASEALEILDRRSDLDLLITDIRMPGDCDGWELARKARARFPNLPVIYTSGYSAEKPQPVDDSVFLHKPFRLSELTSAVAAIARN